ncbi:hypothetical protein N7470_008753 [Penicillium chermesinum]|nr:hypothetical protein N7470_008753 [Penicillium chermesinum]
MESEDGITVRSMRLKVLYTFDNEYKTNCLARWPHVLEIQSAHLDENTVIGVIELKTCIQAIVSASPELVAQLGKDYTVYAYDYSEYETPLVGQGMLSWVLASASPTPDAPAHQSKTMVTGRVCKNPMGLFSKGAGQDTLEVKLRLVPVPTVMQSEYLDNMQKYREANAAPRDFDTQSWANFVRQNPGLNEASRGQQQDHASSPVDHSGIERFHQMLSEGATPREFSTYAGNESVRSSSPTHSFANGSRVSTPGGPLHSAHHQSQQRNSFVQSSDMIRPSSSVSMRDSDYYHTQPPHKRRESLQSGYASGGEEQMDSQPRKRAKLYQAGGSGRSDMNIERQPSSLRVAASTAASVRIHRPTPVNPSIAAEQSNEEPVRPPTPIHRVSNNVRRGQLQSSSLRESSVVSSYQSPYMMSDDIVSDQTTHSPEEQRYQGLFEPSFTMPSSPPVLETRLPPKSSPVLPPIGMDADSGFMSAGLDDIPEEEATTPLESQRAESQGTTGHNVPHFMRPAVQASSPVSMAGTPQDNSNTMFPTNDTQSETAFAEQRFAKQPPIAPRPVSSTSRPVSRSGPRLTPKPLAPAPTTPNLTEAPRGSQALAPMSLPPVPASDPVPPSHPPLQQSQTWAGPMSDFHIVDPSPKPDGSRPRSRASAKRRTKQIQDRLEQAIKAGEVPPFCENCGCIETPTWRRGWSKEFVGNEEQAKAMMEEPHTLFYVSIERDDEDVVTKYKVYKKTLATDDNEWSQVLLCNPCGLWLFKFKAMRPENKWNKQSTDKNAPNKKKRPVRNRTSGGPLSNPSTRTRSKVAVASSVGAASSPAPTEASSVQPEDGVTPGLTPGITPGAEYDMEHDEEHDMDRSASKKRRANSAEPPNSGMFNENNGWEHDAAPGQEHGKSQYASYGRGLSHTEAFAEGALLSTQKQDDRLKEMDPSMINTSSPRRSPRIATNKGRSTPAKENDDPNLQVNSLDALFESPSMDFNPLLSPTPRRRNKMHERRLSLPSDSPSSNRRRNVGLSPSSTQLTAERLQRVQEDQEDMSLRPRDGSNEDMTPPSGEDLQPEAFQPLDPMMLDMFDDPNVDSNYFGLGGDGSGGQDWTTWLPSGYISPNESDSSEQGDDLINAILSDPNVMNENLRNSSLNLFALGDNDLPDSGFFSSDALHDDHQDPTSKPEYKNTQDTANQAAEPSA